MPTLSDRLAALFMRRPADIGLLRTRFEVHGMVQRLPRLSCGRAENGARGVFVGRVRASGGTIVAPVSLQPCVAFRVSRFDGASDPEQAAVPVDIDAAVEFEIEDESGRALVRPGLVSLHVPVTQTIRTHFVCDDAEQLRGWIEQKRRLDPRWSSDAIVMRNVAYTECRLVDGEPVAIIGTARSEIDEHPSQFTERAGGYRDAPQHIVVDAAPDAMFLYVTDWEP